MSDREALQAIAEIIRVGTNFNQDPAVILEDIASLISEQEQDPADSASTSW
tara:strand:- start:405 stop:557 length:153 start_codon:yes stop_codon:yes gene_type:complete